MEGGSITYTFDQRPFGHQLAREPDLAMQTLLTRFGSLLERDLIAPDITDYFDDNQIEWDVDDDDDDDDEEEEVEASKREEAGQKMEPQVKSELSGEGQMSYHMGAISVSQQGFPYPDNIDEDIEAVLALDPVDWMLGTQQEYPSMPHTNSFTAQATQPGDTAVEEEAIMAKWLTFEGVKTEPDEAMAGGPSQTHSLIPTTTQGSDPSFPFLPTTAPTTGPPPTPAPPPPFLRLSDRTLPQLAHQLQPAVDHVNELIASMHYSTDHGYNHLCNIIKNKARDNWLASGGDPNSQGYLFGLDGIFVRVIPFH